MAEMQLCNVLNHHILPFIFDHLVYFLDYITTVKGLFAVIQSNAFCRCFAIHFSLREAETCYCSLLGENPFFFSKITKKSKPMIKALWVHDVMVIGTLDIAEGGSKNQLARANANFSSFCLICQQY